MAFTYSFVDDTAYTANDVNQIISRLTTEGVSLFKYTSGDNPLKALNTAVASIASPGVEYYNINACKLSYDDNSGIYTILQGNAFTADGVTVCIDKDGINVTDEVNAVLKELVYSSDSNAVCYVCFYRDTGHNSVELIIDSDGEKYNSEYSIAIAQIDQSGKIYDTRTFAQTKIAQTSGNIIQKFTCDSYSASSAKKIRKTCENVQQGARYVYYAHEVFEIQRIVTDTGDELTYTQAKYASANDSRCYIACNLINGELQIWLYAIVGSSIISASDIYVF